MDDTESYLNSILKKRLGSVANYNGSSKSAQTATRIPKQQEKVQHMPTVFRKKHETKYIANSQQLSQNFTNTVLTNNNSKLVRQSMLQNEHYHSNRPKSYNYIDDNYEEHAHNSQFQNDKSINSSQRVEYMLISKRIESLKKQQPTMPTVDVTKFKVGKEVNGLRNEKMSHNVDERQQDDYRYSDRNAINSHNDVELGSVMSLNSANQSKRKRIFGNGNKNPQSLQ